MQAGDLSHPYTKVGMRRRSRIGQVSSSVAAKWTTTLPKYHRARHRKQVLAFVTERRSSVPPMPLTEAPDVVRGEIDVEMTHR